MSIYVLDGKQSTLFIFDLLMQNSLNSSFDITQQGNHRSTTYDIGSIATQNKIYLCSVFKITALRHVSSDLDGLMGQTNKSELPGCNASLIF